MSKILKMSNFLELQFLIIAFRLFVRQVFKNFSSNSQFEILARYQVVLLFPLCRTHVIITSFCLLF